jgi:hypothetical protein
MNRESYMGAGVAIGTALFAATGSPVFIAVGAAIGVAMGAALAQQQSDHDDQ